MTVPPPAHRAIAFQGFAGAYSHLACEVAAPRLSPLPCATFDEVFDAVEQHRAVMAAIPVENSQAGRVTDIHRLLPSRDLHVVAEHYQPVQHMLLGPPGATLAGVRRARSHPQALMQCREWLARHGIEAMTASDTAGASREVAALGDPAEAAISSALAGRLYGLTTLAASINDDPNNTTRFLLMAREPADPGTDDGPVITSLVFRCRNLPAALYKSLGGFATNGVNLLKIESYQLGGAFQWTTFAIDFEGHPRHRAVARALEELAFFADEVRVLGTFPSHPWRRR